MVSNVTWPWGLHLPMQELRQAPKNLVVHSPLGLSPYEVGRLGTRYATLMGFHNEKRSLHQRCRKSAPSRGRDRTTMISRVRVVYSTIAAILNL